ncbi:hypothetical protein, partial [uncultured Dialister sp.]|uniref:hypothetical protein n=1 Tax=uncultured Dialister sp. TaxID=278064 RepID=UPI0025FA916C
MEEVIFPKYRYLFDDYALFMSFRAVASAVVTVTIRIVCEERVEKSPREMTITVVQLLILERKTCIPERKKDFSTRRSCSDFGSRAIRHDYTARNDGEWEKPSFRGTILAMVTLP